MSVCGTYVAPLLTGAGLTCLDTRREDQLGDEHRWPLDWP